MEQGLELFVKTIGVAAGDTSGFVVKIDGFLTRLNSTSGFNKWSSEVIKLIGLFDTWVGLFASFGKVMFDFFKPSAGFGDEFAKGLTGAFDSISNWLNKSRRRIFSTACSWHTWSK